LQQIFSYRKKSCKAAFEYFTRNSEYLNITLYLLNRNTVKGRFVASLIANILRSGVSFATAILLARFLGPKDFGRMSFLLVSFAAFRQLLDMGTSTAYFTFLSQKARSPKFVRFFWNWTFIQFLLSVFVIGLLLPENWISQIWKGEHRGLVLLALIAAFMQGSVWLIASQMAEANRQTFLVQRLHTLVVIIHLLAVLLLWQFGNLAIPAVLIATATEWLIASWYASKMYWINKEASMGESMIPQDTTASIFKEFWVYCLPFIPYVWLSFTHDFADRWMLQNWGGSKEQAFYSIAYQFAAISLLATTSILRIFWKEIAEVYHLKDLDRVKTLYQKASRGLYFIGAMVAGLLLPWTEEIIKLTLGTAYLGGAATMMLMFVYPIHQSNGQICNTMFYATGKSKVQVMQGIIFMASSIVVSYFLLSPPDAFIGGFGLKSIGLAYKMVFLQIIFVNVQAWILAKMFKWKFDWTYQVTALVLSVVAGWLAKLIVVGIMGIPVLIEMALAGIIYFSLLVPVLYWQPWIIGLKRSDFMMAYQKIKGK